MGEQRSHQTNTSESSQQRSAMPAFRPPLREATSTGIVSSASNHPLLQLQRQIGNRAVTQLIQAKLSVSQPNDAYEQEADRVADTVMRMPDPVVQRQPSEEEAIQAAPIGRINPLMQRQEEEKEEPVQMLQRQAEEEKEEPVQMLQRQVEEEKPVQAKQATPEAPEVTSDLETRIQSMRGGGQSLSASTRAFFEPRFGYDFSGIRVHTDSQAGDVAQRLNAQAFTLRQDVFFGAGRYQPDTSQGRWLLAHELTHTIQQQPQPLRSVQTAVQAKSSIAPNSEARSPVEIQRRSLPISSTAPQIQRSLLDDARDWIADKAAYIPGYTLLTVLIGRNPINNRRVDPTPTNLVQGVLELIPVVGRLMFQALQASGALDRVFNWVRQEISQLNITWDAIVAAFERVNLSWDDAFSPSGAFRRFQREFSPIIDRVIRFARSVKDRVIAFIKEAILRPLSNFAKGLPVYPLLTVILGKDPITDEEVARTPTNVIRGILLLLPGGEERFQNLQRSGIIDRAFNWFNQELNRLNLTWSFIKSVFVRVWESLSVNDILSPIVAFNRIRAIFSDPVQRIISFAGTAIRKVAEFIFEGVLTLVGGLGQRVLSIFNRARSVLSSIIENPIGFVGNLVNAVKRGFQQFAERSRLLNHLRTGLVAWLLGSLRGSGLQLPERFDLRGIVSLVIQILGLTYANLRGILVRLMGEESVSRAESVFQFLVTLVRDGLAAAWQQIVEFAGNLQEAVIGGIRDWVARTVVGRAVARLVTLFNPAGAIIQAIMAIYNTVVFFIERARQISELAEAVFNSIATIASGNIAAAANYVEQSMARAIPVMLGFFARFIDLGGIGDHIRNVVRRIQAPINRALERVANWIVSQVGGLVGRISGGQNPQERLNNALNAAQAVVDRFAGRRVGALVLRPLLGAIRLRYGLQSLDVVPLGGRWAIEGIVNPRGIVTSGVLVADDLAPGEEEKVLLLGEGDFSFALSLARQVQPSRASGIVATSYEHQTRVEQLYRGAQQNISQLRETGVAVAHGVNATNIDINLGPFPGPFKGIVFNFPFVPGDRPGAVQRNVAMLQGFFASASRSLLPGGKVFITSKEYWLIRFRPVELATGAGLTQDGTPRRFEAGEFPGYEHRESLEDVSAANTRTAITFIFRK